MNKADRAEELFKQEGLNCAQAVVCAFADEVGVDIETLAKISSSFGGGVARTGEICGAVSGMCMIAGLLKSKGMEAEAADKPAHYAYVRTLMDKFKEKHGSIICRELLEMDKNCHSCVQLVRDAAEIMGKELA
jgi:C_GCAxxG_C_C family probable redox protein